MLPDTLLPNIDFIQLDHLELQSDCLHIQLHADSVSSPCPTCQKVSSYVHSRYIRVLSDLPWAGIEVKVKLKVRRFFCKEESCARKFFTKRLEGLKSYARRTERFTTHLLAIGMKLGGNAGAGLAKSLGMPSSATTILRLLHLGEEIEFDTPRVLGVDDWAFHKGKTYGTILVDLEKQRPVDLLPDRESETLERWLKQHPGVEIISRDRSNAFSEGARKGAPNAKQVADRWHLLKNLLEALKGAMDKHRQASNKAAVEIADKRRAEQVKKQTIKEIVPENAPRKERLPSKYELMFEKVKKLQKLGLSQREIFRRTGIHRKTIAKYFQYEKYPKRAVSINRAPKATPFDDYLYKRWVEGKRNYRQLWREIRELGFDGSYNRFFLYMKHNYPVKGKSKNQAVPLQPKVYSARRLSYLLFRDSDDLKEKEIEYLKHFFQHCPEASLANKLALQFKSLLLNRQVNLLDPWLEEALDSGDRVLKGFAKALMQDYDAVKNACSTEWSNGQVEGQINRLKNIKRQMYGRASFQLLRRRVLADTS